MELRQLAYVEAVARLRHFTRAAEELHVAQPALSHQISKLEAELGTELFERTSRRVVPTAAGTALAVRARRVLSEVDAARGDLDEIRGLLRGRIAIGALLTAGGVDVPGLLVSFRDQHPGVDIGLQAGTAGNLIASLLADRLDLAFVMVAEPPPAAIGTETISSEELVIAFPPGEGPKPRGMTPESLSDSNLISPERGSATKAAIDEFLGEAAPGVRIPLESGDPYLLRCLVSRGFGAAVLPRSMTTDPGPPVDSRPLQPAVSVPVALAWRRDRSLSPAARAFAGFTRDRIAGSVTTAG